MVGRSRETGAESGTISAVGKWFSIIVQVPETTISSTTARRGTRTWSLVLSLWHKPKAPGTGAGGSNSVVHLCFATFAQTLLRPMVVALLQAPSPAGRNRCSDAGAPPRYK